jgi:zinc transport system substrate-binding protein
MAKIEKSALVIFSGGGLEPWTDGFNFKNNALNISKYVKLREMHKPSHKQEHSSSHHHHSKTDPHYWLDIDNMVIATKVITKNLIQITPKKESFYKENEKNYIAMLEKLKEAYNTNLTECKHNTLVTNHNAFSYVAKKYGFKTAALSGLSPQAMPSAKTITSLMKRIEKDKIRTIFFESFANEKVIRTIAKDANINVDVLHPLGNITADQANKHLTYEKIMKENLTKISKALECN